MAKQYRERIYKSYVTHKMSLAREYERAEYERWAVSTYSQIRNWLPVDKDAKLLDAGCGDGNLLFMLAKYGYRDYQGVDRSNEQLMLARAVTDRLVNGDVLEFLSGISDTYAVIFAFDLIEHLTKDELFSFLEAAHRALIGGGSLIIQTPNADSPFGLTHRYNDLTHEIAFNPHSLENVLRLVGFQRIDFKEAGPVVLGAKSFVRWLVWKLIRSGLVIWNLAETGQVGSGIFTRVFRARAVRV